VFTHNALIKIIHYGSQLKITKFIQSFLRMYDYLLNEKHAGKIYAGQYIYDNDLLGHTTIQSFT